MKGNDAPLLFGDAPPLHPTPLLYIHCYNGMNCGLKQLTNFSVLIRFRNSQLATPGKLEKYLGDNAHAYSHESISDPEGILELADVSNIVLYKLDRWRNDFSVSIS